MNADLNDARVRAEALRDAASAWLLGGCYETVGDVYFDAGQILAVEKWLRDRAAALDLDGLFTPAGNPDRGPRCGECRLGLGVHEPRDPQCAWHSDTLTDGRGSE